MGKRARNNLDPKKAKPFEAQKGMMTRKTQRVKISLAGKPPYPFCRTPSECAGKGYCSKDPACND